jgi:hypothetical protein
MNEKSVYVADDNLVAIDGECASQQVFFAVDRLHHARYLARPLRSP